MPVEAPVSKYQNQKETCFFSENENEKQQILINIYIIHLTPQRN